ncbi:Uncharacterised protein [Mycobacterium tuberculosis]|nr:Uncharacterised protein [Mycobacterium tuberculosis]CFR98073.1 Uncharacterised protein [Mycobacterium tuberculosis]CFS36449.1 Uncharacterised protein [Mycobacterium tuberculosis]CKR00006.1 Uncharacterised protein [Mycobacterium tuberculosis]CKR69559.1 Uncharacterised protein [Mycobacterium tuberculosis]
MMMTTLVMADVWLAGGLVPMTLPTSSGVDGEFACLKRPNPAAVSFLTASAYVSVETSGISRCSGPVDTLTVISSPALTDVLAAGSVPITWSGGIVESGFCKVRILKPRFCSVAMASAED